MLGGKLSKPTYRLHMGFKWPMVQRSAKSHTLNQPLCEIYIDVLSIARRCQAQASCPQANCRVAASVHITSASLEMDLRCYQDCKRSKTQLETKVLLDAIPTIEGFIESFWCTQRARGACRWMPSSHALGAKTILTVNSSRRSRRDLAAQRP